MANLPEELIANIISHILGQQTDGLAAYWHDNWECHPPSLARYAAVSRSWQARIEARTFAHITLTPARVDSALAAQALSPSRVHHFVRTVKVGVLLPPYGEDARTRCEDSEEKLANDRAFTDFIRNVFALLSSPFPAVGRPLGNPGGDDAGNARQGFGSPSYRPKIKLCMTAHCVSDTEDSDGQRYRRTINTLSSEDIFEARYESSYLDINPSAGRTVRDEADALPQLLCISDFHVQATQALGRRLFAPRALCLLASRMPGLQGVAWDLCDNEKRDLALRKGLRSDFAGSLDMLPSSLQTFYLLYDRQPPLNHSYQPPSVLDETDQDGDKLSVALRKLSHRLGSFTLLADVGPEIFWPSETERREDTAQPRWPTMRKYSITPGPIDPSGEWRYRRAPDYSDTDDDEGSMDSMLAYEASIAAPGDDWEDPFREELDGDAVGQLLLAAARAAACMPKLFSMSFTMNPPARGDELDFFYTARRKAGVGVPKLCIGSHPVYHPDEEVLNLWREAARVNVGAELEVVTDNGQPW